MESFGNTLQPFLAWLLETTLVASVVIGLILILQKLLGRRLGPRWSHALWLVLLLRMVLPWTPPSPVSLFNLIPASLQRDAARQTTSSIPPENAFRPADSAGTMEGTSVAEPAPTESAAEPAKPRPQEIVRATSPPAPLLTAIRRMLPVFWLGGAILLGGYLVASNFALWRIIKREHPLVEQPILELFEQCKSQMGVVTIVALVPSDEVKAAALFGFVRPRLLLPREMVDTASPDELRYIFLHELAHLKRHDIYLGWLTSILQVLHWFNPLVWLAFYRMRSDRELACDALVLTRTEADESHDYGRTMVGLLGRFSRSRPLPAMAGILESKSQLRRRITMIARFENNRYRWSPTSIVLIVALACVSLMKAQQPGTSPTSAGNRGNSMFLQDVIVDPNTRLEFRKVCGITGSKDVIDMTYHGTHMDMSPNGRFLLCGGHIIPLAEGDLRELTNGDLRVGRVRWSPDGTMIAFYSDGGIWVMPISQETGETTGPAKRLVDGEYWYQFSVQWSPDSEKLVYRGPGHDNLHVVSVRDGTTSQITTGNALRKIQGGWSPDGKWIAYNQEDNSIWVVPSEGGQSRKLADVAGRGIPHWTPDGQWVVCQWNHDLRFIRFSDGMIVNVDVPRGVGAFFSWSPDNKKMLFYKPSYGWQDSLRIISVSGGQPIAPDALSTGRPKWTPDGRFIFTWGDYQDRYLYWVTPFGAGAAEPYPLLLDRPYGYVPGMTPYAQESLSPSKEKLLFTAHTESGNIENWVVPISARRGASTGPAVKVFDKGPFKRDACWSPDESKIALLYGGDLWVAHTDGSQPVKFTATADRDVVRRAWSPDGSAISWISHDPNTGQSALRIRSLSGDQSREIASTPKFIRHPWSPDGTWIAYEFYANESDTTRELYVVPAAGGEPTRLIEAPYDYHAAFNFAWHPQDDQLALVCGQELLLFDPANGQRQQVASLPNPIWGRVFDMRWSPDGKMLGLVLEAKPNSTRDGRDISGGTRLFTVTIPGGKWTELAGEAGTNYYFVWSPDGKWVAYNSEGWIRKQPEGVLWEANVDAFLRQAAGEEAASQAIAVKPEPALHRIEVRTPGRVHSRPSPDGKYLSGVDDAGDLILREPATGKQWKLTEKGPESKDFAHGSLISPDSARVAYYWFNAKTEDFDLRVVGLDGSNDRLLWAAEDGARSFNMRVWAPDGKHIFGEFLGEDEPVRLIRVSAKDGCRNVVKAFDRTRLFTVDTSPDGRYLAYDVADSEASNRDILVLDLEGNRETPVVTHPANDKLLGWTPDGRHIFFASDRNGTWDAWLLQVDDGTPHGLPEMIKAGMGDVTPVGFTRDGAFFYEYKHSGWNVYTGVLGEDHSELVEGPEPVRQVGKDGFPDWSPDGRHLAYMSQPDRDKPPTIRIRTRGTDREREITPDLPHCQWLRWCPDSRHLLLTDVAGQSAVYKLDVDTGRCNSLIQKDQEDTGGRIRQAELSMDGRTLAYRIRGRGNLNRLVIRNLDTGQERELLRTEAMGATHLGFANGWALSPDGAKVALCMREGSADNPMALKVMSVESGKCTTIVDEGANQVAWTTDGCGLLITRHQTGLWAVSAEGGEPRKLLEWNGPIIAPRIHPDGRHMAFFSGARISELWVMENFLPTAVARVSR